MFLSLHLLSPHFTHTFILFKSLISFYLHLYVYSYFNFYFNHYFHPSLIFILILILMGIGQAILDKNSNQISLHLSLFRIQITHFLLLSLLIFQSFLYFYPYTSLFIFSIITYLFLYVSLAFQFYEIRSSYTR